MEGPDARVRIKVKITVGGEVYLYADATDLAAGLGKPREIELNRVASDPDTARVYRYARSRSPAGKAGEGP